MSNFRGVLALVLIFGLIAGGCESDSLPYTVAVYRPSAQPVMKKAPCDGVYILWEWIPVVPVMADTIAATQPTSGSARQRAVEVKQVFVADGCPVGFSKCDGKLMAIADTIRVPLEDAHYTWAAKDDPPGPGHLISDVARGTLVVTSWGVFGFGCICYIFHGIPFLKN